MPKRSVSGQAEAGEAIGVAALPTWQATGLSLAVIVGDVFKGSGALVFGLLSVGVIWTLHRLHTRAPAARSTAELIASVPGAAPASALRVLQFAAYVVMGAYVARLVIVGMTLVWFAEPKGWWAPALSVAAVVVAAALVGALPTRLLAPVVTVLAAVALLVFFYLALAVIARVASGTAPIEPTMELGAVPPPAEWGPAALVVSLAIAFAGFEIPTAVSDRLTSVRRPLGYAMGLTALCAATAWVAANVGSTGEFRYDAGDLAQAAAEMFGETGSLSFLVATIAQAIAALLVLVWGSTRVVRRPFSDSPMPLVVTTVVMAVLAFVLSSGWGDVGWKFWGVAGVLLLVIYVAAAQANSRLDDSSTPAWALFALMGVVLAAVVFLIGVSMSWWSVGIPAGIVAAAAAWAAFSRENRKA
jgi:hypothetical protein